MLPSERGYCATICCALARALIMRMSKYKMLRMVDYLARDTAKSGQLNIDDGAVERLHARRTQFAAQFSATEEAAPQIDDRSGSTYYSVIVRAVSELPNNTPEARRALYDRAGITLAAELLQDPQISDAQVADERLAFERAIRKVERNARKKEQSTTHHQEKRRRPFSSVLSFFRILKL